MKSLNRLRVVFMGTPEFAVPSLKALLINGIHVVSVVTQPDRPRGRGHQISLSPVKKFAQEKKLLILQPININSTDVIEQLINLEPDLIIVVAFGQILSQKILDIPRLGCINVHASLLPKYRGAAPIERALINGEKITGVTIMQMDSGLDTGDVLLSRIVKITDDMILPELRDQLMLVGANLLIETINKLCNNELQPIKQDDTLATFAPLFKKSIVINWNESSQIIHNLVRGLYGKVKAGKYKIYRTKLAEENISIGKIKIVKDRLFVGTADGSIEILEIQAPNSKRLSMADFLHGNRCEICLNDNF